MTRLKVISSYINEGEKVIDVGCDQALLSKLLAKRKIHSIASDLRKNIIENAKRNITDEESKYITFRVGSGVTLTSDEKDYTLVMSGMGTYLMLDIIKNTTCRFKKIITISNNNHDILRREMKKLDYYVNLETIIKEKGKYYNLIIFDNKEKDHTEEELLIGYNHQDKLLLKEKNEYLISKYEKILSKTNNEELTKIVNIMKNYKY